MIEQEINKCTIQMDFESNELGSELQPLNFAFYKQQLRSLTKPCTLIITKLEKEHSVFKDTL